MFLLTTFNREWLTYAIANQAKNNENNHKTLENQTFIVKK